MSENRANPARIEHRGASAFLAGGSLVCSLNPIFRPYGVGRVQKEKNGIVKVKYSPSVFMQPPYRSENRLLKIEETEAVDTPLERMGTSVIVRG